MEQLLCRLELPEDYDPLKAVETPIIPDEKFYLIDSHGRVVDDVTGDIGGEQWKYKWNKLHLTWKLTNHTHDIGSQYIQQRTFAAAFQSISMFTNLKFSYQRNSSIKTDVNIEFTSDLSVFDNKQTVLAQAWLVHPSGKNNGLIQFNDNYFFTPDGRPLEAYKIDQVHYSPNERWANGRLKMLATQPMMSIGQHEGGHMLGLRHDMNSEDSMMYPYAAKGYTGAYETLEINPRAFIWSAEDQWWLQQKYGKRNLPSHIFMRIRNRRLNMNVFDRYYDSL